MLRLNDERLVPYEVNAGGPGMYRDQKLKNFTVTADWQVAKNLFVNLAPQLPEDGRPRSSS